MLDDRTMKIVASPPQCQENVHIYLNAQGTCLCGLRSLERKEPDLYNTGWICPACGRGNAPHVAQCCCPGKLASESSTAFDPKTIL